MCWPFFNLLTHAFIYDYEKDDPEAVITGLKNWRKKGPIGKIHSLVHHSRKTSKRREKYRDIQIQDGGDDTVVTTAVSDNETRWNSTYKSIQSVLRAQTRCQLYQLEMARTSYLSWERVSQDEIHTIEDWDELTEECAILGPFSTVTIRLEGHATDGTRGSVWEVLPYMEYLFGHLHKVRENLELLPKRKFMLRAVKLAIKKLEEYYHKTNENVAIVASLVMNSTIKWAYLK